MSGYPPEVGQARVRAQLAAEGKLKDEQTIDPEQLFPQELQQPAQIPDAFMDSGDPIVEALQTLPDQDLEKLANLHNIRPGSNRTALIKALALKGLGPKNLPE